LNYWSFLKKKKASALEGIASILLFSTQYTKLCTNVLESSLNLYLLIPDYIKYSVVLRTLISRGKDREESLPYFNDITKLLEKIRTKEYPQEELNWLIVRAFNNGVFYFKLLKFDLAEKWMSISISLLQYYDTISKLKIEKQILDAYSEVLGKSKKEDIALNPEKIF